MLSKQFAATERRLSLPLKVLAGQSVFDEPPTIIGRDHANLGVLHTVSSVAHTGMFPRLPDGGKVPLQNTAALDQLEWGADFGLK